LCFFSLLSYLIFFQSRKKRNRGKKKKKWKKRRFKSELSMFIPETPEDVGRMRGYLIFLLEKKDFCRLSLIFLSSLQKRSVSKMRRSQGGSSHLSSLLSRVKEKKEKRTKKKISFSTLAHSLCRKERYGRDRTSHPALGWLYYDFFLEMILPQLHQR